MEITKGQTIKFRLDHSVPGEGIVKVIWNYCFEVELTKPCKEFVVGEVILVDITELT